MRTKLSLIGISLLLTLALTPYIPATNYFFYKAKNTSFFIFPIEHGTLNIEYDHQSIYIDPIDEAAFKDFSQPSIILVTHDHPDHFNPKALTALATSSTTIIGPAKVIAQLNNHKQIEAKEIKVLNMDESLQLDLKGTPLKVDAIAAYNTTDTHLDFHPKGLGNGYVLNYKDTKVYISGDTENTPQMRALENIDVALICMNQPYTMTTDQAASAVNDFKPKVVIPYHYRNEDKTFSNLKTFATQVQPGIQVKLLKWYSNESIPTDKEISYSLITFP